jgi:plasmid maintenance system antidote protein VapI
VEPTPQGYSTRQAVNENEIYSDLATVTQGYGGVVKFARRIGVSREYIHRMLDGTQRVSAKVAAGLGWELRWVRR